MNTGFKLSVIALVTLCATSPAMPPIRQGQKETAQQHIDKARTAIEKNNLDAAEKEAKRALAIEKNLPEAYLLLATIYHQQQNPAEALKAVTNAITRQPDFPDAHYLKAVLYYEAADNDRAASEIKIALDQGERLADAFALAGDLKLASYPIPSAERDLPFPGTAGDPRNRALYESAGIIYEAGRKAASPADPGLKKLQFRIEAIREILDHMDEPSPGPEDKLPPSNARIKLLTNPAPNYTEEALRKKEQGVVTVGVFFGADGSIAGAIVIRGLKYGLNEIALKAVYQVKFTPAMAGGKPISVFKFVRVSFALVEALTGRGQQKAIDWSVMQRSLFTSRNCA